MEVRGILETVSRVRKEIQERRELRAGSRSISPIGGWEKGNESVGLLGRKGKNEGILRNCEEVFDKFLGERCPLPKYKGRSRTYKFDAVELIFFTLKKPVLRYFGELKLFGARKKTSNKKPPICRSARTRSDSRGSLAEYSLDYAQRSFRAQGSSYLFASFLFKLLQTKVLQSKFGVFSKLKSSFRVFPGLNPLKSLLKNRFFHIFSCFKPQDPIFSSAITTPKFLLPFTPTKPLSKSFQIPLKTRSNTRLYIPGTIIKTNLNKTTEKEAPNSSDEPERNPTFGPDSEESMCLEDLRAQNSLRSIQIKKSLNELEFYNEKHKSELSRSKRSSLGSYVPSDSFLSIEGKNDSFISQSAKKIGFKGLISPIRLLNKYDLNEGVSEVTGNEENEEMSLKSFHQFSQYLSFDKESSVMKNGNKEGLDSFERKLIKGVGGEKVKPCDIDSARGTKRVLRGNLNNPAAQNRKRLLARLEGLSRLEDIFSLRFQELFLQITEIILQTSKTLCLQKLKRIPVHLYRTFLTNILSIRSKILYTKRIKSLVSCLNYNFFQCKEKTWRKWQMRVRLQIIKEKEISAGIRSLFEVLKKHFFTKKFFVLNLLKYIGKKKLYGKSQYNSGYKTGFYIILKVFNLKIQESIFKKWSSWKKSGKWKGCTLNLVEICKKKYFPVLWVGWKGLKNLDKVNLKLRQKILLKKYIEVWVDYKYKQSNLWIELFYLWKRILCQEKVNKLKGYKKVFL